MAETQEPNRERMQETEEAARRDRLGRRWELTPARKAALERGRRSRWAGNLPKPMTGLEVRLRRLTPQSEPVRQVLDELLAVQAELAQPMEQDLPLLAALAQALTVLRLATQDVLRYGLTTQDGRERPAAKLVLHAADTVARLADRLAIGPAARSKLGVGGPRTLDDLLAEALRATAPPPYSTPRQPEPPEPRPAGGEEAGEP